MQPPSYNVVFRVFHTHIFSFMVGMHHLSFGWYRVRFFSRHSVQLTHLIHLYYTEIIMNLIQMVPQKQRFSCLKLSEAASRGTRRHNPVGPGSVLGVCNTSSPSSSPNQPLLWHPKQGKKHR